MKRLSWIASVAGLGLVGALGGAWASGVVTAQDAPESLLPPGFDDPVPAPTPTPVPTALPTAAPQPATPQPGTPSVVQPGPAPVLGDLPSVPQISSEELSELPSVEELEEMSTDQLDDLLGLKPQYDIPPAARRSLSQVGLLDPEEGGLPTESLSRQPAALVRAVLGGTRKPLVSRWGHILLRRALASRLATPEGMNPVEFAALRAGVLNRLGEHVVARSLAQDVDTGNWNEALTSEALTAYIAAADFVGACPAVRLQGSAREDAQWVMLQAICNAYAGEGALAGSQLDRALGEELAPPIDVLLAQRYAGAAGRGRRAVEIEWEGVEELNPWRFALANAVGETVPEALIEDADPYYERTAAVGAMVPLAQRALFAQRAAREGILSAHAMIQLYSQIYADTSISGEAADDAARLREAYIADDPASRVAAMRTMWGTLDDELDQPDYAASVTTAFAAARISPSGALARHSGELIASMLTAGLDRDAASWASVVEQGSLGWALVVTARPNGGAVSEAAVASFIEENGSYEARKSAFLVAGLGGLGRISQSELNGLSSELDLALSRQTRWSQMIERAADAGNPTLVAMLAGLGMQGASWEQMTPLHLYHITSALSRVGLEAEARMIAAEAVARG
ncbi:MAG: hypothetical protein AAF941_10120 [Pseudomonadota bacterium]